MHIKNIILYEGNADVIPIKDELYYDKINKTIKNIIDKLNVNNKIKDELKNLYEININEKLNKKLDEIDKVLKS
jgi:Mg2+ and Co2+ transporter CorA